MRATLSDSIRIPRVEIPDTVRLAIEQQLTIPNPAKDLAQRELLWGADRMDDHMRLYGYDDDGCMVLPMGFKHALLQGLNYYGIQLEVVDERKYNSSPHRPHPTRNTTPIELRGYQEPMCQALIDGECGVVEAPTAAGKTAVSLEAIRRVDQYALVIVEKASLAQQWAKACQDLLGIDPGYLGEGETRWGGITIALRQAMWARRQELWDQGFFYWWGAVLIDECHHAATAASLIGLIQRFNARYRWGVTATPDRDPAYFPVLQAVVGPVLWETTMQDAADHLVIPRVRVLESTFEFDFHPTSWAMIDGRRRKIRNNYNDMMAAICTDRHRNAIIAAAAAMEARAGHHILIVSQRKEQLYHIRDLIGDGELLIHTLVGGEASRMLDIKRTIETADCGSILLSTIADEGLSIDRLDRVIPAYPRRNPETMRQIAGRIMRPWPGKQDAVLIDIRDSHQELLRSQFKDRAQLLYGREGWVIERASALAS